MDVDSILPGRDFRRAIEESINACSVVLIVIGQHWVEARDSFGQRRLEDAGDFVRLEIASALKRDVPVIPVLVSGAKMPRPDQLPEEIRDLAYRNAVELTHTRWKSDVQVLIQSLGRYMSDGLGGSAAILDDLESERLRGSTPTASSVPKPMGSSVAATIEQPELDRVTKELAHYIGPIAEIVVKRAARKCGSVAELYRLVAHEVEPAAEKAKFLSLCK